MTFKKADSTETQEPSIYCTHPGCKNRWSIDLGGAKCSLHQWGSQPEPVNVNSLKKLMSPDEKVVTLKRMRQLNPQPSKAWAYALKERDEAGECLTSHQKKSYKEALKYELL